MKDLLRITLAVCALLAFTALTPAQDKHVPKRASKPSVKQNPAVVVVRSAAKGTWAVTRFTARTVANPVAKTVLLKFTPAASKFLLKTAAKNALPLVVKLSVL